MLGGRIIQVDTTKGTNCAPLLTHLFVYSYKGDVIQELTKKHGMKLAGSVNLTTRMIDVFH